MNGSQNDIKRLHDLVDDLLPPADKRELLEEMRADERLRKEHARVLALHTFLNSSMDVDPPDDLATSILERVRERRTRRFFVLPGWAENALVFGGASALAAVVAVGRFAGPGWAAPWLGRLTIGATDAVEVAKVAAIGTSGSVEQMDWLVRLFGTLSGAGWKALGSSADVLVLCGLASLALTTVAARMLWHNGRLVRVRGGAGNAHLLA